MKYVLQHMQIMCYYEGAGRSTLDMRRAFKFRSRTHADSVRKDMASSNWEVHEIEDDFVTTQEPGKYTVKLPSSELVVTHDFHPDASHTNVSVNSETLEVFLPPNIQARSDTLSNVSIILILSRLLPYIIYRNEQRGMELMQHIANLIEEEPK